MSNENKDTPPPPPPVQIPPPMRDELVTHGSRPNNFK